MLPCFSNRPKNRPALFHTGKTRQLNTLEKSFLSLQLPAPLALIWQDEINKLSSAISAIKAGSDPSLLFDLQTAEIAAASWQTIADFANQLHQAPHVDDSILVSCEDKSITLMNNK